MSLLHATMDSWSRADALVQRVEEINGPSDRPVKTAARTFLSKHKQFVPVVDADDAAAPISREMRDVCDAFIRDHWSRVADKDVPSYQKVSVVCEPDALDAAIQLVEVAGSWDAANDALARLTRLRGKL